MPEVGMIIRRVGVWSVARLYGAILGVIGLLAGVIFALVAVLGGVAGAMGGSDARAGLAAGGLSAVFGIGAVIILPVCYAVMGVISGAIGAALYNLFAGMFGGIELEVEP